MMRDKPKVDIGLLFGSPKGEADMGGPDEDFKDLAHTVLDDKGDMATRVDALHELIMHCMKMSEGDEDEEAPASEREDSSGGY
jgi:hypothetical protein